MEESSMSTPFNDWSWQTPIFYSESLDFFCHGEEFNK
jgi:hypothetical protein